MGALPCPHAMHAQETHSGLSRPPECRFLNQLSNLSLWDVPVWLPALACIVPQLRNLDFKASRLQTGGVATDIFAACGRLEEFYLTASVLDNRISRVAMPSLTALHLRGIELQLAGVAEQHYDCVELFAHGCPKVKELSFTFSGKAVPVCKGFRDLQVLETEWDFEALRTGDWPANPPRMSCQ